MLALSTFWPRKYEVLDLRGLRDEYLAAETEFTKLRILDTQIDVAETLAISLLTKARRLKASMGALAAAALITAVGLRLH